MNKSAEYILCMAVIAVMSISTAASAQTLTLDNFKCGAYTKHLSTNTTDTHYAPLCHNSKLGAARQTLFGASPAYAQPSTLAIGHGIWILDAGFGTPSGADVSYGFTTSGVEVPLDLDLSGYTGLQLNFAGVATDEDLGVIVAVTVASGTYDSGSPAILYPTPNAFSVEYPFSGFSGGGLAQSDVSNISYITIEAFGGGYASYGITSFQAYK